MGRQGDEVKLTCPLEANPAPMIVWFKDTEEIDYQWTRFNPKGRHLRVRDASPSDSGRYMCRGINGFGKEEIFVDLIVIDPAEFPDLGEGELPDLAPPSLSPDTLAAREEYEKKAGETITVSCTANGGKPGPKLRWFKNGVELVDNVEYSAGGKASLLRIRNLRSEDSGTYTCLASNMAGQASKDYRLTVRNTLMDNPVFYAPPTNQTVTAGETAALDCRVHSSVQPTIKWLKRLDLNRDRYSDIEVITVGNESYRIIDRLGGDGGVYDTRHEVYMSQLELVNTQPGDAGMYICFVTNSMGGFNFKPAYLSVLYPLSNGDTVFESPLVLAISISLAGVTLFILVGLLVCLIRNRNKKPEHNESGEVRSTLICPVPPPPSVQDTLYSKSELHSSLNHAPSLPDTVYTKSGQPLPPPPTPVQWSLLYGTTGGNSYTDSSHYGGNTYEVPRYEQQQRAYNDPRISPVGQPGYVYGGYRHTNDMY